MTGGLNNRRIVDRDRDGARDAVYRQDLDQRFLILKNGRITLSVDALRAALGIEAIAAQAAAGVTVEPTTAEVEVFAGAGADGLVPDPGSETGLFLRDDGTWAAASGGSGAPTGSAYVTIGNDGALSAERALTGSGRVSVTDGGANGNVTLDIPDGGVTRAKLESGSGNSVIGRASNTIGPEADIVATTTGQVLRQSGSVLGFGKIGTDSIDVDAVDNTQLNNMLTSRIKGRVTAGTGDPEDLTAAQVRTLINVADGANAYVHPNHSGDVTSVADGAQTIAANAVTDTKLRDSSALSVIGRSDNSVGDPADIATTSGSNNVLRETGGALAWGKIGSATIAAGAVDTAALADLNVTLGKIARMSGGGPGLMTADLTGDAEWKGPANFPAIPWFRDGSTEVAFPRWSGTTFPTSVADGQHFYHTTHNVAYSYNSAAGGWLSIGVYEIPYGNSGDTSGSAYAELGEIAAFPTYSSTIGHIFGFAVKVSGITLIQATAPGATVTVEVVDDGVGIGASAQLATTLQADAVETLLSTTIASNSIIAVRILSGTAEGPYRGIVRFRRFET